MKLKIETISPLKELVVQISNSISSIDSDVTEIQKEISKNENFKIESSGKLQKLQNYFEDLK